jgi:hypothetical protein
MSDQKLIDRIEQLEQLLGVDDEYEQEIRSVLNRRGGQTIVSKPTGKMIGFLSRRLFASREAIYTVLYGNRNECDQPDIKIIDQVVWRARRALKPYGIKITTEWTIGYSMSNVDKKRLRVLLDRNRVDMPDPRDHRSSGETLGGPQ